jgi:hypothetical protein
MTDNTLGAGQERLDEIRGGTNAIGANDSVDAAAVGERTSSDAHASLGAARSSPAINRYDVLIPSFVFLMSRFAVLVTAKAVTWARPEASVLQLLSAWDGSWYLTIAESGYPQSTGQDLFPGGNRWAFSPAYPVLVRVVHELTGLSFTASGLVTSMMAGTLAMVAIWVLIAERLGRDAALLTVGMVSFFPAGYVLGMAYTESLFLLLAATCLRAVGHRQWILAGLLASAAYLTRPQGNVLLGVVIACGFWTLVRERTLRPLWAVALAPVAPALWSWYQWVQTGTAFASVEAQDQWGQRFVWFSTPFRSLWRITTDRSAWSSAPDVTAAGGLVFAAISVVLAARYVRSHPRVVPLEWLLYSAVMIMVSFSPLWASSILRYQIGLFPLFAVAWHTVPKWTTGTMIAAGGVFMGALAFSAFLGSLSFTTAPFAP